MSSTSTPLSPSKVQMSKVTTAIKRPPSPKSNSPSKIQKVERIEVEALDDEIGFDQDALIEATLAAEEEEVMKKSSQSTPHSSNGTSSEVKSSTIATQKPKSTTSTATKTTTTILSHGDDALEAETMDKEWYDRLKGEMQKPYFQKLKVFLKAETAAKKVIYPPSHLVHSWSRLTPLSNVKVVIVGQDPYHGPNQACGHSFSVPKPQAIPPSLRNIYKEISNEYASFKTPGHGCLDGWATQGVLLLNACLTVEKEKAGSHHNKGWEPFTQAVLKAVAENASKGQKSSIKSSAIASMFSKVDKDVKKEVDAEKAKAADNLSNSASKGVCFLAWGTPAQKSLREAGITEKTPNVLILSSVHPSPLSAMRGFMGNGHFKKANDWLESDARYGKGGGIDWSKL